MIWKENMQKKTGVKDIEQSYVRTAEAYAALGDHKKAYEFLSVYIGVKDSLLNEDTSAKLVRLQANAESPINWIKSNCWKRKPKSRSFFFNKAKSTDSDRCNCPALPGLDWVPFCTKPTDQQIKK